MNACYNYFLKNWKHFVNLLLVSMIWATAGIFAKFIFETYKTHIKLVFGQEFYYISILIGAVLILYALVLINYFTQKHNIVTIGSVESL